MRIWDLRRKKCIHIIPAHSKLISSLKYQPGNGNFLVTASLDHTCKIWDTSDYNPLRILTGHEDKIMCADVSKDSSSIITSGFDRTWKLWGIE